MPAAPLQLIEAGPAPTGLIISAREAVRGAATEPASPGPGLPMATDAETRTTTRWEQGFTIDPDPCGGGLVIDPCGNDGGESPLDPDDIGPIHPTVLSAVVECSTFGSGPEQRRAKALRKLAAVESFQLEREFWLGAVAAAAGYTENQWLADPTTLTIINSGGPMGAVTAFAELEQAIGDASSWQVGFIHATLRTVTNWFQLGLLERRGNLLVSALGTVVVPGRGYPGSGPGDTDGLDNLGGDADWAYATGTVFVRLGPIIVTDESEATDTSDGAVTNRQTNLRTLGAYRTGTANHDGCIHAAALVRHDLERTAVGS